MAITDFNTNAVKGVDYVPFFPLSKTSPGWDTTAQITLNLQTHGDIKKSIVSQVPLFVGIPPTIPTSLASLGDGVVLQQVTNLSSCELLFNSWYYDILSTTLYVNTSTANYTNIKAYTKTSMRLLTTVPWVYKTSITTPNIIFDFMFFCSAPGTADWRSLVFYLGLATSAVNDIDTLTPYTANYKRFSLQGYTSSTTEYGLTSVPTGTSSSFGILYSASAYNYAYIQNLSVRIINGYVSVINKSTGDTLSTTLPLGGDFLTTWYFGMKLTAIPANNQVIAIDDITLYSVENIT
jgi:hypothetical protein